MFLCHFSRQGFGYALECDFDIGKRACDLGHGIDDRFDVALRGAVENKKIGHTAVPPFRDIADSPLH